MADIQDIQDKLWAAADELRANSRLKASEYSIPVLGLIFLRYADGRFAEAEADLEGKGSGRREIGREAYQAKGVLYLPPEARFSYLLDLPEGADIGKALNDAMKAIEADNEDLKGVLPKGYNQMENATLVVLLKLMSSIPVDVEGDVIGKVFEYFLGNFAMSEGSKGGEFYTPTSIVRLIVEIIEPFHGRIYDPACGSGGMFVQSARFVEEHSGKDPSQEISVYGQERVAETIRLAKMNLAVHGLSGDIKQANSYYEDEHKSLGKFDFVMANPPFNVDRISKERLVDDPRYPYGIPRADNGNYLWINLFASSLNGNGRAGFVMANSASTAGHSELEIRKNLLGEGMVDVIIETSPKFFYTVPLAVTLWFLDKGKRDTDRAGDVLFINAKRLYRQIDRAHRDFTPEQIDLIANTVRLYRDEDLSAEEASVDLIAETFELSSDEESVQIGYKDIPGYCKVATIDEIEAQGWSLNPGRYVGVAEGEEEDFDFAERLEELNEELEVLNSEAGELQDDIAWNVSALLEGSTD